MKTLVVLLRYHRMQYICDAPGQKSWFQIETEGEAARKSDAMSHAVEKHFRQAHEAAVKPISQAQHLHRAEHRPCGSCAARHAGVPDLARCRGHALATAMLPPGGRESQPSGSSLSDLRTRSPTLTRRMPSGRWASISASPWIAPAATHSQPPPLLEVSVGPINFHMMS